MIKKQIILIGGGGHCRSVIDVIEQENIYEIAGIVDKPNRVGEFVLGYEIITSDDKIKELYKIYEYAFVAVGHVTSNEARVRIFKELKEIGFKIPTIISPLAYVSKHAQIGEGTIVMHHALVNANVQIGLNCIINTKSLVEHDSIIENNAHISTSATVNGGVRVKENSFIGSNSTIREAIEVGGFIKAGSVQR